MTQEAIGDDSTALEMVRADIALLEEDFNLAKKEVGAYNVAAIAKNEIETVLTAILTQFASRVFARPRAQFFDRLTILLSLVRVGTPPKLGLMPLYVEHGYERISSAMLYEQATNYGAPIALFSIANEIVDGTNMPRALRHVGVSLTVNGTTTSRFSIAELQADRTCLLTSWSKQPFVAAVQHSSEDPRLTTLSPGSSMSN